MWRRSSSVAKYMQYEFLCQYCLGVLLITLLFLVCLFLFCIVMSKEGTLYRVALATVITCADYIIVTRLYMLNVRPGFNSFLSISIPILHVFIKDQFNVLTNRMNPIHFYSIQIQFNNIA